LAATGNRIAACCLGSRSWGKNSRGSDGITSQMVYDRVVTQLMEAGKRKARWRDRKREEAARATRGGW